MNNRGITLVELLVVVSIIGILVVVLAFNYRGWMGRYKMEGATKTLQMDLMDARNQAVQRAATFLADFPTTMTYRVGSDTSGNGTIEEAEVLNTFPIDPISLKREKRVDYTITGGVLLTFDSKGLIYSGSPTPVLIDPANPVQISLTPPTEVDADYDCIRIGPTRINMGKMQGVVCNVK